MDKTGSNFDWGLVQSLQSVIETGSLSAAARSLGQSQPTIGRHIKALEAQLGQELFTRAPRGLVPTEFAMNLGPHLAAMAQAAAAMSLGAAGREETLAGTVRITASVVVSHFILPKCLAKLRVAHPEIQIELVPSDTSENLIFREADIAVRMYRPTQLDVITTKVTEQEIGLYAGSSYLERVGRPKSQEELLALDFVGFDKSDLAIRAMSGLGLEVTHDFFPLRCDDQAAYWHLVCAGCGIGAAQTKIGDATPEVERIFPALELPPLPVWLTAPEALRSTPRIRAVWEFLIQELSA